MSLPYQNPNVTQSDVRQAVRNCKFIRALYSDDTFWIKEELEMAIGRPYKTIRLTKNKVQPTFARDGNYTYLDHVFSCLTIWVTWLIK